jgi:hypothetical protein
MSEIAFAMPAGDDPFLDEGAHGLSDCFSAHTKFSGKEVLWFELVFSGPHVLDLVQQVFFGLKIERKIAFFHLDLSSASQVSTKKYRAVNPASPSLQWVERISSPTFLSNFGTSVQTNVIRTKPKNGRRLKAR